MACGLTISGRRTHSVRLGLVMLTAIALTAMEAAAATRVYTYVDANGVTVFTDRKPENTRYRVRNLGCFGTCRTGVDWERTALFNGLFQSEIETVSEAFGVDAALIRAVVHAESGFQPDAVSHAGARGLMQLMPGTAKRFSVVDAFNPQQNITGGAAYLAWLLNEFEGDLTRAIAAYNAGENAVHRYGGVPPFPETREFVRRVTILLRRYSGAG